MHEHVIEMISIAARRP